MKCRKAVEAVSVTPEQMEKINAYTRRALTAEEVFVFTVILCDNEVDRDHERFPTESLEALRDLFLGKTGVFDHAPTAEHQAARIFDTALERFEEINSAGEPYARLKAWAYMVRCDKNADLILEIDAGIKKEVSVSCAVEKVLCSVCSADQRQGACSHRKGERYDGQCCHHLLVHPTDAYEWSFVAVPAQKQAGVIKRCGAPAVPNDVNAAQMQELHRLAALGERCEQKLRRDVVKYGLLGGSGMDEATLKSMTGKLNAPELEALCRTFSAAASRQYPLQASTPQLAPKSESTPDHPFQI